MEHYEKLIVFADAQAHKLHDELKAMQIVCLQATLETKAMCAEVTNILVKVIQTMAGNVTEDKVLSRIFGNSEDSVAVDAKEAVKAQNQRPYPTYDELLDEAIARTKKLSLNDIKDKDPDVLVCHMDPKYKVRPDLGKDYSPYRKAMERCRKDASNPEKMTDEEIKTQLANMIRGRAPTPVVDCATVNFDSTQEQVDALRATLDTVEVKGHIKRRHGVVKSVEQQKKNRASRSKKTPKEYKKGIADVMDEENPTSDEDEEEVPKKVPAKQNAIQTRSTGAVPKRPTARKSTTTPKKLKKPPVVDPLDMLKPRATSPSTAIALDELKVKEELIEFTETKAKYAKASNNNPKVPDSSDMEEVLDSD